MSLGKDSITKRVAKPTAPEATKAAPKAPAAPEAIKAAPKTTKAAAPKKTTAVKEDKMAPELVGTTAAAPKKAPAKKSATTTAKKPAATKIAAKKPTTKEKLSPPTDAPSIAFVDTTVLANVSPETVKAVTGHEENRGFEKIQLCQELPVHLL